MSAPYVAGDHDQPEWWSPADDEILRGELAKLAELPRPATLPQRVPAEPERTFPTPRRRATAREIGAMVIVFAAMLALLVIGFSNDPASSSGACGGQPSACADPPCAGDPASGCTPTTYDPPGPSGGVWTSMPVR